MRTSFPRPLVAEGRRGSQSFAATAQCPSFLWSHDRMRPCATVEFYWAATMVADGRRRSQDNNYHFCINGFCIAATSCDLLRPVVVVARSLCFFDSRPFFCDHGRTRSQSYSLVHDRCDRRSHAVAEIFPGRYDRLRPSATHGRRQVNINKSFCLLDTFSRPSATVCDRLRPSIPRIYSPQQLTATVCDRVRPCATVCEINLFAAIIYCDRLRPTVAKIKM
jgi:hypothetical protein